MSILDWCFIVLFSLAILLLLSSGFCLFLRMNYSKNYQRMKKRRPKNKKKYKKWRSSYRQLQKKAKKTLRNAILLIVFSTMCFAVSFYTRYYQLTHLNAEDGEIIVQTYFLVDSIEKDLLSIQNGKKPVELQEKLQNTTSMLVSYGSQPPSIGLSAEGQQLLNQYYVNSKEFGMNLNSQTLEKLEEKRTIENYLLDTKKLKANQQVIFKTFNLNESALKQKK